MDEERTEEQQAATHDLNNQNEVKEKKQEDDKEHNFAQLRQKIKERDDYIYHLKQEVDNIKKSFQKQDPVKEEPDLGDDDFITKKDLERYARKIAKENIQNEISAYEQKNYKTRARETYSDYDQVVTQENLQRLEDEMPEIAQIIGQEKDKYKMACGAYKAIKTLSKVNSPEKEIERNKEALEKNKKEPMSASAVDRRPIAQAARLSDKDYQELWNEMQYYASKA